jgi:fatty-acyl-CoA synthase
MSAGTLPGLLEALAATRSDAPALVSLSRPPLSRAACAAQARRVAEGLSRQGIGPGDRVALLLPNRPEFILLLLALARLGATAVPLDPRLGVEEIATLLSRARAVGVAVGWGGDGALPRRLEAALAVARAPLRCVIGLDAGGVDRLDGLPVLPWKALDAMPEHEAMLATDDSIVLALPAGEARLALHAQGSVARHAAAVARALELGEDSAVLPALPMACPDGLALAIAALSAGARLLCPEEAGPGPADALARAHGATHLLAGSQEMAALAGLAARRPYATLRVGLCPGRVEAAGLPLRESWGGAETQGLFALLGEGGFRPVHPATLRLADGILEIQAPSLLSGFDGEAEALTPDGFLRTGQPAGLAGEAFLPAGPRPDGCFHRDGMVVAPAALARFLARQPGVAEAAVGAAPDGAVVGFVVALPDGSVDEAALLETCREALAQPGQPARVLVVESLPADPAGAAAGLMAAPASGA